MLAIFVRVIVPVAVTVVVGYIAARVLVLDLKMLARLGLYVLVPCLTFTSMARTTLEAGEFGLIVAFTLLSVPILYALSAFAARLLKLPPAESGSLPHLGPVRQRRQHRLPRPAPGLRHRAPSSAASSTP
ncbi:MAG: hypothetical protein MZU95_06685 [Desulfomicrobium escambiense]|nr:hypothetical protein [Desulfomicrobium escambiense]